MSGREILLVLVLVLILCGTILVVKAMDHQEQMRCLDKWQPESGSFPRGNDYYIVEDGVCE